VAARAGSGLAQRREQGSREAACGAMRARSRRQRRGDIQATEVSCDASKEELLVGGYSACRLLLVATPHCFDSILFFFEKRFDLVADWD